MTIDAEFVILWCFAFLKNACGSFNFRQIWAIVVKLHTHIILLQFSQWHRNNVTLRGYTSVNAENLDDFWEFFGRKVLN